MMQGSGKGEKIISLKWLKFLFWTGIQSLYNIISAWLQGDHLNIFSTASQRFYSSFCWLPKGNQMYIRPSAEQLHLTSVKAVLQIN